MTTAARRLPLPGSVEHQQACFVVRDYSGRALGLSAMKINRTAVGPLSLRTATPFRFTDVLSAYQSSIAPNYFVSGFSARVATQNKFVRHFETVRNADPNPTVRLIYDDTIVLYRARFDENGRYLPNRPTYRATLLFKRLPDHGVTNRFGDTPDAIFIESKLPDSQLRTS